MTLLEALKIARHDVGKYIAMQCRWAEEDLRDALIADLVHTHRTADASHSAVDLWNRVRPSVVEAGGEGDRLATLDEAFSIIQRFVDAPGDIGDDELSQARDAALVVSDGLREWYAEVRALG